MFLDAASKLESFRKEKEYLENHLLFTQHNVFQKEGHEIVEVYTEEEDKAWRQKHRENVRNSKKGKAKEEEKLREEVADEELWNRLEELELEEELENELLDNYNEIGDIRKDNSFLFNEEKELLNNFKEEQPKSHNQLCHDKLPQNKVNKTVIDETKYGLKDKIAEVINETTESKLELLQQVLEKQNQLEDKLIELKNRDRAPSKTENDLMSRLDEMEQLDELEDEMDRLDDVLETEDIESEEGEENIVKTTPNKLKKSISFADEVEDTSETLEITFKHSEVEPGNEPYNKEKGISKPSDVYEAYSHLFDGKPASILKKLKCDSDNVEKALPSKQVTYSTVDYPEIEVYPVKETIVVRDVKEYSSNKLRKIDTDVRPTSLFRKKRMQNKS